MAFVQRALVVLDDINFDMQIDFDLDDASPVANPYVDPRHGSLATVQTDGTLAVTGSELVFTAQSTPVWGDLGAYYAAGFTREAGRTLFAVMNLTTWEEAGIGWHTSAAVPDLSSAEHSLYAHSTDGQLRIEAIGNILGGLSLSTDYKLAIMLRATGAFTFVHDGNVWLLVDINDVGATAALYPVLSILDGAGNFPTFRSDLFNAALIPKPTPLSDDFSLIPAIADVGANALDGTPVRVGLDGSEGYCDGDNSYIQLPASAIEAAGFDASRFGIAIRAQVTSADIWSDGVGRGLFNLGADASNFIDLRRSAGANSLRARHVGGGTTTQISITASPTALFGLGMTVDIDAGGSGELKAFLDGAQTGATGTSLGTFVNSLVDSLSVVGALSSSAVNVWQGGIQEVILTLNAIVPTETQFNFITNTGNTITDSYLDTQFGAGNWVRLPITEQYATSGLGHLEADGSGSGKSRNGPTFSSAGSKRYNGAVGGADVIITGDFASDSDWDKGTGWAIAAGIASKTAGTGSDLGQTVDPLTSGIWYKLTYTVSGRTAGAITPKFGTAAGVARSTNATFTEIVKANAAAFDLSADSSFDGDIDDVIVVPYTLAEMLDLVETSTPEIIYRVPFTIIASTPGGIGLAWDSVSSPQNGLMVYYDRVDNKIKVDKWLSGAFSSNLISQSASYSAAGILECRLSDSDSDGTYTLTTYYKRGNKSTTTFSDAAIIGNTVHGLMGLLEGGDGESENVWDANLGTALDKYFVGA